MRQVGSIVSRSQSINYDANGLFIIWLLYRDQEAWSLCVIFLNYTDDVLRDIFYARISCNIFLCQLLRLLFTWTLSLLVVHVQDLIQSNHSIYVVLHMRREDSVKLFIQTMMAGGNASLVTRSATLLSTTRTNVFCGLIYLECILSGRHVGN